MVSAYDVLVLGAGPAGLATALSLRNLSDCSILIADAGEQKRERAGESAPPDLLAPLRRLQLEANFLAAGHMHSPGSAVRWGREQVGYNDHLLNPMGPSWRLNRPVFDAMLVEAALERGISVQWNTRYLRAKANESGFLLTLAERAGLEQEIQARWVVDATGPLARFANDLGVKKRTDDQLFGLAGFSTVQSGQMQKQVLVESTPEGWWYAAYLPDHRIIHMFVTDAPQLRQLKSAGMAGWAALLSRTQLLGPALANVQLASPEFHTFPIYSSLLEQTYGEHWLAVGDAAATYDPIASQGLYKALSDGVTAGRVLAAVLQGQRQELEQYDRGVKERYARYFDQRCGLYEQERRWAGAEFWRNRSTQII